MSTAPEPITPDLVAESTGTLPERILLVGRDQSPLFEQLFPSCELTEIADREEAVHVIDKAKPGLVVVDVEGQEGIGPDFIERIRSTSAGACVPILVIADQSEEPQVLECVRVGADDFLTRPFSNERLHLRVSALSLRQKIAKDANPLTGLPGNDLLKQVIEKRIAAEEITGICIIDLDHFKEFNDTHGFDRGDHIIQLVASILTTYSKRFEPGEVFVGHIGGDDFVCVLPMKNVQDMAAFMFAEFVASTEVFYSPEELADQYYVATNRRGEQEQIPLVSVSIGVVTTEREDMDDVRRVAQVSAEVKSVAKKTPGNSIFIDRRIS